MKKSFLIITLYGNSNYGNKLQNYALQETICKIDKDCIVKTAKIKYRNSNIIKYIYRVLKDFFSSFKKKSIRERKFLEFNKKFINYNTKSKSTNLILNLKGFDYYIYGSDQIWNPYNCGWSNLFLGLKSFNNISYSASIGVKEIPKKYILNYIKSFNNFKYISVREDSGKKIIEDLTSRTDVEVLVDPTMLLTSEEWDKISVKPKNFDKLNGKKYVLNYFLGNLSKERKQEIERVAKENDCEIINLLDKNDTFYVSGPSEFLYLEKHAFLICTDSFHSSVFAILYNRPFVIFDRDDNTANMGSRLDTLISKFKLKNRRYNGKNITKENLEHNYTEAYKILEKEREKSDKFLRKALDIDK